MPTAKPLLQAPHFHTQILAGFFLLLLRNSILPCSYPWAHSKVILQPGLPLTFLFPHGHIFLRYSTSALALWAQPGQLLTFCLSFHCLSRHFSLPGCHHSWFTFPTRTCIFSSLGPRAWERHLANNHKMTSLPAFRALILIILCHKD